MKKFIAVFMVITMLMTLGAPAFATGTETTVYDGMTLSNVVEERWEPVTNFPTFISMTGNNGWASAYLIGTRSSDGSNVPVYYCNSPATLSITEEAYLPMWYHAYDGQLAGTMTNNLVEDENGYIVGTMTYNEPGEYLFNDQGMFFFSNFIIVVLGNGETVDGNIAKRNAANSGTVIYNIYPADWAYDQVMRARDYVGTNLMSQFNKDITREEFCLLAVGAYENILGSTIDTRSTFSDTTNENVEKAASVGIVNGMGNGMFDPTAKLTREQGAAMLANLAEAVGKPLADSAVTFSDSSQISDWAMASIGQMQASGIMGGMTATEFGPKSPYTREQSMVTIMRLIDMAHGE